MEKQKRRIGKIEGTGAEYSSKSRLRWVMTTVLIAFLLLITYFLATNYFSALAKGEKGSLLRLAGIANTLSLQIDGDAHQRLMAKYSGQDAISTSQQDSLYFKLHEVLQRNYAANMLNTPIYTIVLDSANNCFFAVTSADAPSFRHAYQSAPSLLMKQHIESAMIPRHKDASGTWLSAFAAVHNRKGNVVALVQVNENFDEFLAQNRASMLRNLFISLLVSIFFVAMMMRIVQPILHREQESKAALEAADLENKRINGQLKTSLEQITDLDTSRREMLANLSHDIRTPMASILGYLETVILKKSQLSAQEHEKFLQVAWVEANRLHRLVAELFDLSKLESGQIQIEPEPFHLAELAQDILHKYQLQVDAKHIKLLTEFPQDLPMVRADVRWTDRILQNLLDNALCHAQEGGFVKFTIFEEAEKLQVKVCNSGDPIPEAHLSRVFDRYFKSSNRKKDSTGLGLTIVKKLIDLHGERVWAESNDQVTTFRFTLPVYR